MVKAGIFLLARLWPVLSGTPEWFWIVTGAGLLTMLIGVIVFDAIGIDGQRAVIDIFVTPLLASYKWQDVAVKAAPLVIIALGLSISLVAILLTKKLPDNASAEPVH